VHIPYPYPIAYLLQPSRLKKPANEALRYRGLYSWTSLLFQTAYGAFPSCLVRFMACAEAILEKDSEAYGSSFTNDDPTSISMVG
ncbi:hypothetical protein AB4Z21_38750, partial [Paenibacillus sp. MCAF20]